MFVRLAITLLVTAIIFVAMLSIADAKGAVMASPHKQALVRNEASSILRAAPFVSCAIGALAIPIHYDTNGLPIIMIMIGTPSQVVKLVVDTGSPDILVRIPHAFNERNSSTILTSQTCTRVAFGTQADHVCWLQDTVSLAGRCVDNVTDLLTSESSMGLPQGRVDYENVWFLGSSHRERSEHAEPNIPVSNYDVMGLARNSTDEDLISQLVGTKSSSRDMKDGVFTFIFGDAEATGSRSTVAHLIIGRLETPSLTYHSLKTVFDPDFFRVELHGMSVGNLAVHPCPKHAIIDSGSNYVFAPPGAVEALKRRMRSRQTLVLDFGTVKLRVPSSAYLAPDGGYYVEVSKSPPDVLVLGTMYLRNAIVEFDANQKSIRVAELVH